MSPGDACWPDGSPRFWPDGTPRSWGNGFTHGCSDRPHGYVGHRRAAASARAKGSSRPHRPFGSSDGCIPGMGSDYPVPQFLKKARA